MSANQNTNKNNNNEPKFDEYLAYEELRMIFAIAIETQNFENIEARIAAWERKYPLAEFQNPEIIRKIKTILNKDFLSRLLGDYLAAKVLHEQEKQKEAYNSLKEIIDKAKKTKNYKTAQKEISKWKDELHSKGLSLYSFNRLYRARVCTLLLLPSNELKNQEQASDELKKIKENGHSMDSNTYFEAISNWQNTYSISDFPDKLKKEINQITTEVFDSISQKRTSEKAITEIEEALSSNKTTLPVNAIAAILSKYDYKRFPEQAISTIEKLNMQAMSMQDSILNNGISGVDLSVITSISPTEATAISSLKDILNNTPHDMDTILNWIYVNRKINYSETARENILGQFLTAGYKIPEQSSFAIPEINANFDTAKIDDLRKNVILNYLGIISQGKKLSLEGKDKLIDAHAMSEQQVTIETSPKPVLFLEAFDTVIEQPKEEQEKLYDAKGETIIANQEEEIQNIFVEDILDNPVATYSIPTSDVDESVKGPDNENTSSEPEKPLEQEPEVETTTLIEDTENEGSLTNDDNENLEHTYEMSTYVVVAYPILAQVLAPKKERSTKKIKMFDRTKDL